MMDSAAARPDDEEARRRRSTDCIYFLGSPLTCKKGSECDYRHSDAARTNPRDCWYWFNASCTNPKCSFRHPPLENLLGTPATPRAPQPQPPVPAQQAHGSSSMIPSSGTGTAKQGVPCYYFQKGMCAKGDKCAFLHVPQAAANSAAPQPMQKVFTSALQPNPQLKNSWTKPNSTAQRNTAPGIFVDKSKVSGRDGKPAEKQDPTRRVGHSTRIYQNHCNPYVQSGSAKHYQSQPCVKDDIAENGEEVGEFVREPSSAASGVLVGGTDYESFKGGKHNSYDRPSGDREQYTVMRQTRGTQEPERPYKSSDKTLLSDSKGISHHREPTSVSAAGSSDLRHRLLKQRRLSNPRSSRASDRHDDHHGSRRNEQAADDGLTRSRLHGRIKLPQETPSDRLDSCSEREKDRGPRARLSPPKHTDLRAKLHERLKARSHEDIPDNDAKSLLKKASIGEDAGSLNFVGPKSLAELKAKKILGSSGEDATASFVGLAHRASEIAASRDSSESVTFEGPKPLSVILKRKREAVSRNAADSGSIHEEDIVKVEGKSQTLQSDPIEMNMEANGDDEEEDAFHPEEDMAYDDNLSSGVVEGKEMENMDGNEDDDEEEGAFQPDDDKFSYGAAEGKEMEANGDEEEEHAFHPDDNMAYDNNISSGAVEDEGKELENMEANGDEEEDAFHLEDDIAYDDNLSFDAVEDEGKELEEPEEEDYEYDAADINANEDNDYQEYEDDDNLEDDDDFARKVGVVIS